MKISVPRWIKYTDMTSKIVKLRKIKLKMHFIQWERFLIQAQTTQTIRYIFNAFNYKI